MKHTSKCKNVAQDVILIISILLLSAPSFAVGLKDVRLMPISAHELQQAILQTPLDDAKQEQLTARAVDSQLSKTAYEQYTILWKRTPNDGYANLRRGVAASIFWRNGTLPSVHEIPIGSQQDKELYAVACSCLEKAIILLPNSGLAKSEYGFLLWQYGNQMSKGLALMKKALLVEPKNANVHSRLGGVYSNPTTGVYSPQKAEIELRTALHYDPSDAYPHYQLARLYMQEAKYAKAQSELKTYTNMGNINADQLPGVVFLQSLMEDGLHKK